MGCTDACCPMQALINGISLYHLVQSHNITTKMMSASASSRQRRICALFSIAAKSHRTIWSENSVYHTGRIFKCLDEREGGNYLKIKGKFLFHLKQDRNRQNSSCDSSWASLGSVSFFHSWVPRRLPHQTGWSGQSGEACGLNISHKEKMHPRLSPHFDF